MRAGSRAWAALALALAVTAGSAPAWTQGFGIPTHAGVSPPGPDRRLGEPSLYRGWLVVAPGQKVRWLAPDRSGDLSWGPVRSGRAPLRGRLGEGTPWPADSVWVESPLQIFSPGIVRVPGFEFRVDEGTRAERAGQLPQLRLNVRPVIAADDSTAQLRPARGPLAAPWWELVPWPLLALVAVVVTVAVVLVRRLRRRKPVTAVPVRAAVKRRDPGAEALAGLASLRRRGLPEAGRFAEHAFLLGQILRRYLEATVHVPRPGDTTPELIRHLGSGGFSPEDLTRLTGLLRRWDGIKFARLASDAEEAARCEEAVRELVVKRSRAARQEVA